MNRASFVGLLLTAALSLGLAFTVWPRTEHPTSPLGLREPGVIRIGYAIEAPYAFLRADGEVTGESPEVARRVVARLGIPHIEWRLAEFSELISELEDGRIDVIAAPFAQPDTPPGRVGYGAFAFRKSDTHLHAAWSAAQAGYVGTPEHRALIAAFGFDEGELPGTVRTREILAR